MTTCSRAAGAAGLLLLTACAAPGPPGSARPYHPGIFAERVTGPPPTQSPCVDSLYLALKARPLDGLSPREYEYFREHDHACMEYRATKNGGGSSRSQSQDILLSAVATVGILVIIAAVAN